MRNLTMMTDLYELTMMNGYLRHGMKDSRACFDVFYRKQGDITSYAIAAGLEQAVEYIKNLHFSDEDIAYLRSLGIFDEAFLAYLADFHFTGDIAAIPEGTVIFPDEPILRVIAPIMEAQLLETALLNILGHQTLIATKASRIIQAARGDRVLEFGLRRAQGPDAGIYGARAAIIGGFQATSNVLTGQMFDVPVGGTHAHSWVMSFPDELTAFRAYADVFPNQCLLLVDTYDTLGSGVPNAITVFNELRARGIEPMGIRLDSGDLAFLSRQARRMLDEAGFPNAKIFASGDIDEEIIWDLKAQGAAIDVWGIGTKLITSLDNPCLGAVYKLAAQEMNGVFEPRIKISENPAKVTNPGIKQVLRYYDRRTGKALADLIALDDENLSGSEPIEIFDPEHTWKRMTLCDYEARSLLVPVFEKGELVYDLPTLHEIADYQKCELNTFWDEYKRLHSPHRYKVDLSEGLYTLKSRLLGQRKA
ncbi:MAG: nicotinate phosphoribosyltransferase [Clostridiales bacterium]|nr:nicotinate phosphoribosyltransferase [Clostridiales bacterium]